MAQQVSQFQVKTEEVEMKQDPHHEDQIENIE